MGKQLIDKSTVFTTKVIAHFLQFLLHTGSACSAHEIIIYREVLIF